MENTENLVRRKELVKLVANNCSYHQYEVEDMLIALEGVMRRLLLEDKTVKLGELFKISTRVEAPRKRYSAFKKDHYMMGPAKYLYLKTNKGFKRELDATLVEPKAE